MKIRSYKSILLALSFILLTTACSKEELEQTPDIISSAGIIHNQLLENYYQNRSNTSPHMNEMISELISLSSEFLLIEGYDKQELMRTESLLKKEFGPPHLKSVMDDDYCMDIEGLSDQLGEIDQYSDRFIEEVKQVLVLVEEVDIEVVFDYINSDFAHLEFHVQTDCDGQMLFLNIFNASYEYWSDENNLNLKSVQEGKELKPSSWVLINDGIGGILGSVFGPIGSIVVATAFSVGTNEEIRN